MNVSIFGLGYVGTVCAACFVELGHRVTGVEKARIKVDLIKSGKSPVVEPELDEKIRAAVASGQLTATTDAATAINNSELSIICVGTPAGRDGGLDLTAVRQVATEIGRGLRDKKGSHTIVVRSTVLPGTTVNTIVPLIESASGKTLGSGFEVAFNPEFLREGCAISDFASPSKTVVGASNPQTADQVMSLYEGLPGARMTPPIETAELVKYIDNTWHALKVAFANEVGLVSKSLDIDSREVIDIFLQDTRLNISSAYLRPGFAFGGSCLPKDVRALNHLAKERGLSIPLIDSVLPSNRMIMERGIDWILSHGGKRVAFLGISFKAGTDDLRESPYVSLVNHLLDQGREVRIFDPNVQFAQLVGANKEFLSRSPHLVALLQDDPESTIAWADIVVLTTPDPRYVQALELVKDGQIALDLSGHESIRASKTATQGFLW